jgi:Lon protease-like protein
VTTRLPLFPLGTVLFPGLVLPLHVFEERYRTLVRRLREQPDGPPRHFGVVAIKQGWEVDHHAGNTASLTLQEIGCTAEIRQITEHADGRFDLVTVGGRRFRVTDIDTDASPFLEAEIDWLDEEAGPPGEAESLVPGVLELFQRYLQLIRPADAGEQLPDDPTVLSHLVAASAALPLDDRQALLEAPDAATRLRAERTLLGREVALLRQVRAVPVPLRELAVNMSPN